MMNRKFFTLIPAAFIGGGLLREGALKKKARRAYPCLGSIVPAGGSRMNVWVQGEGTQSVVFLSGYGTPCPAVDFQPLIRRLESRFLCVVPEPLGHGASEQPRGRRSGVNIIRELRQGLKCAGIMPPYILAGHSMAGFIMPLWCCMYPGEIKAVIGIDTSVPEQVNVPAVRGSRKIRALRPILESLSGYARLRLRRGDFDERLKSFCLSIPEALPKIREIAADASFGRGICGEGRCFTENALYAQRFSYPAELPVIMFVSLQMDAQVRALGFDWLEGHRRQLKRLKSSRVIPLEAAHYLHHEAADKMAEETLRFMAQYNVC